MSTARRLVFESFNDADAKRLRTQFGVPPAKAARFIRQTRDYVAAFSEGRYDKDSVKGHLAQVRKNSDALLHICQSVLWPSSTEIYDERLRAGHRILQACGFRLSPAKDGNYANALRSQFLAKNALLEDSARHVPGARLLAVARQTLIDSMLPNHEPGQQARAFFISLLAALSDAAALGINIETEPRGRPSAERVLWLARGLSAVYESHTGLEPTKGRTGRFGKYLSLCLNAAGEPRKDVMPVLQKVLELRSRKDRIALAAKKGPGHALDAFLYRQVNK
jgi:hypothetical protein